MKQHSDENHHSLLRATALTIVLTLAGLNLPASAATAGLAGLGILSGEHSGTGGLLGSDALNNDSALGLQLGHTSLLNLGDVADPLANAARSLRQPLRAGADSLTAAARGNALLNTLLNAAPGERLNLAPLAGLALGAPADASGNLVGAGLLTGSQAINRNLISTVVGGGNTTGNGQLAGTAVLSGNRAGNGGLVGAALLGGDASGNGGLLGISILGGNNSGNGGLAGVSVLSGNNTGNGGLLGASLASGDNSGNVLGLGEAALLRFLIDGLASASGSRDLTGLLGARILSGAGAQGSAADLDLLGARDLLALSLFRRPVLALGPGVPQLTSALSGLRITLGSNARALRPQLLALPGAGGANLPVAVLSRELGLGGLLELAYGPNVIDARNRLLAIRALSGQRGGNGDVVSLSLIGNGNNANAALLGGALLDGGNSGNGGLAGVAVLGGNNSGNGGVVGAAVLSGNNSGNGGLLGVSLLSGENSGNSGALGLAGIAAISGNNSGNGGAVGVGAASGEMSGNTGLAGLSALFAGLGDQIINNGRPLADLDLASGAGAINAELLDLGLLQNSDLLDVQLAGVRILRLRDRVRLAALFANLRNRLRNQGRQLVPTLLALPGGQTVLLPLIIEISEATEQLAGLLLGPALDPSGNVLGLALLRDRPDGSDGAPQIGLAVLGGDNDGNGEQAGIAVLSGDDSGNGGLLGAAVLSGDNSGNGTLAGTNVLSGGDDGQGDEVPAASDNAGFGDMLTGLLGGGSGDADSNNDGAAPLTSGGGGNTGVEDVATPVTGTEADDQLALLDGGSNGLDNGLTLPGLEGTLADNAAGGTNLTGTEGGAGSGNSDADSSSANFATDGAGPENADANTAGTQQDASGDNTGLAGNGGQSDNPASSGNSNEDAGQRRVRGCVTSAHDKDLKTDDDQDQIRCTRAPESTQTRL